MVLETINLGWLERKPAMIFFFGAAYALFGYLIAMLFFGSNSSVAMLFLTTLLAVPTLIRLLDAEESIESREGFHHFIRNHRKVIEVYLFLFLGIFVGYLLLGLFSQDFTFVFGFQLKFLERQEGLSTQLITRFLDRPIEPSFSQVLTILSNNLLVSAICFVLSVFYGAGAIFLLVFNASIFSSFAVYIAHQLAKLPTDALAVIGFFSIHLIPEVLGFLLAAIAGGVVSKAMLTEKLSGPGFTNVLRDAMILLLLSACFIAIGAVLEVYATAPLFHQYF